MNPSVADVRYAEAQRLIAVLEGDIEKLRAERDEALRAERDWARATAKTATDAFAALRAEVELITDDTDFAVDEFGSLDPISIDPGQVAPVMVLRSVASRLRAALAGHGNQTQSPDSESGAPTGTDEENTDVYHAAALAYCQTKFNYLPIAYIQGELGAREHAERDAKGLITEEWLRAVVDAVLNVERSRMQADTQTATDALIALRRVASGVVASLTDMAMFGGNPANLTVRADGLAVKLRAALAAHDNPKTTCTALRTEVKRIADEAARTLEPASLRYANLQQVVYELRAALAGHDNPEKRGGLHE